MKEKKTTKYEEKSKTKKGRTLRVPGGARTVLAASTQESTSSPEEVTAGFKAGKDLEA
jgi:hypothetical protein